MEDRIGIALRSYSENDKPIAKLAREFNVPYQLLRGRINGAKSQKGRTGTHKALDAEQEEAVIQWMRTLDNACRHDSRLCYLDS